MTLVSMNVTQRNVRNIRLHILSMGTKGSMDVYTETRMVKRTKQASCLYKLVTVKAIQRASIKGTLGNSKNTFHGASE